MRATVIYAQTKIIGYVVFVLVNIFSLNLQTLSLLCTRLKFKDFLDRKQNWCNGKMHIICINGSHYKYLKGAVTGFLCSV